jgi:putative membrane protein
VLLFAGALLITSVIAAVGGYLHFRRVDHAIRTGTTIGPGPAAHLLSGALLACLAIAAIYVATRA